MDDGDGKGGRGDGRRDYERLKGQWRRELLEKTWKVRERRHEDGGQYKQLKRKGSSKRWERIQKETTGAREVMGTTGKE